jgi:hypothetical protein
MGENVQGNKGEESVLNAWKNNAVHALTTEKEMLLSGPKVQSFGPGNLQGKMDEVTNDAWMENFASFREGYNPLKAAKLTIVDPRFIGGKGELGVKSGGYMAMSAAARRAAEALTRRTGEVWTPAEVQETVWSWTKGTVETRANPKLGGGFEGDTVTKMLKKGTVTDDIIDATPDFDILLHQGKYRQVLEEAGYGKQLQESLARRSGTQTSESGGILSPRPGPIKRVADRLERTYRRGARIAVSRAARTQGGLDTGIDGGRGLFKRASGTPQRVLNSDAVRYTPDKGYKKKLTTLGASVPDMHEVTGANAAKDFVDSLTRAKTKLGVDGVSVTPYKPEDYAGAKIYMDKNGGVGFAIKEDGDIVSVFANPDSKYNNVTTSLMHLAVQQGGRKLDAFNIYLSDIYLNAGFKPVARVKWNDAHAPEGWDKANFKKYNNGEPDVYLWAYDPLADVKSIKKDGKFIQKNIPEFKNWDDAAAAQDLAVQNPTQKPTKNKMRGVLSGTGQEKGILSGN